MSKIRSVPKKRMMRSRGELGDGLMPRRAPLAMPAQDFNDVVRLPLRQKRAQSWQARMPRIAVALGTALITFAFSYELYDALAVDAITPLQVVFLILSSAAFSWIAFGTLSATLGFLVLFSGERADTVSVPSAPQPLKSKTALLFPVYHEDPGPVAGVIEAIAKDLAQLNKADRFDVFVLSDTRGDEAGALEQKRYGLVREALLGIIPVYYRRRDDNAGKKAGNIKSWVENHGAAYDHFVILDADSVMSGETLAKLVCTMEQTPTAGLIQTVPRLIGGKTLLQRLQQYAANIYGPCVAAGLAFWHRDQGNYWGHNAIIRTEAFASAAGLPPLPGRAPFGGHIQSHDFVEAVLLQRAGWGVHMVPTMGGSYEGLPPNLVDVIKRDRRWAQGNLQHLSIVPADGLTTMGRVHLLMGAFSYIVSSVWALSLIVGVVLALQAQQKIPAYFTDSLTLFPIWPVLDSGVALKLFAATMFVVLLPKLLGLSLELRRNLREQDASGAVRAVAGVTTETVFSVLLAPILMVTQTMAVVQVLLGRDSGWSPQQRADGRLTFDEAVGFHWRHTVIGLVGAYACWQVSPQLLLWMSPVLIGLVFAAPLGWYMSRPAGLFQRAVLSVPEQRLPPAILNHARSFGERWSGRFEEIVVPEGPQKSARPLPKTRPVKRAA